MRYAEPKQKRPDWGALPREGRFCCSDKVDRYILLLVTKRSGQTLGWPQPSCAYPPSSLLHLLLPWLQA